MKNFKNSNVHVRVDVKMEKCGEGGVSSSRQMNDVISWFREVAMKEGILHDQIVYGDKLYKEVFG